MKNKMVKRIGALILGAFVLAGPSMQVCAMERSYTYNYDWWGDVQDSPDAYTVCGVYTSMDFGLDVKLKSPEGLYVSGNLVYICATGNNRIVVLDSNYRLVRLIEQVTENDVQTLLNTPSSVFLADGLL